MLSLFKIITRKYYLIPNLGNLYEDKMTVFKYTLTSLLAISTSFLCDHLHHVKNPLQQHTELPKIKSGTLYCSSLDAQCSAHRWGRTASAANGLKLPKPPARPGLAQGLECPSA